MSNVKELSIDVCEILDRISFIKNKIISEKNIGENDILKGIIICEEVIKEINPDKFDSYNVSLIRDTIIKIVLSKEEKEQNVSNYVKDGIYRCFLIIDVYSSIHSKCDLKKNRYF